MTLPDERVRAINSAHEFLRDLMDRSYRPSWTELRQRARRVLKHHPSATSMALLMFTKEHERAAKRLYDEEENSL